MAECCDSCQQVARIVLRGVAEGKTVEIDGLDVRKIKLASIGRIVGFVTQETYLFHSSIRDNLRYARPEATDLELEVDTFLCSQLLLKLGNLGHQIFFGWLCHQTYPPPWAGC